VALPRRRRLHRRARPRSAVIDMFIEQVRWHGHDPFAYFKRGFERLPGMTNQDDFAPLLPWH
jgi:hypothetical protein